MKRCMAMKNSIWVVRTLVDVVNPEPRTGLDSWNRWQNDIQSQFVLLAARRGSGKVIEVVEL